MMRTAVQSRKHADRWDVEAIAGYIVSPKVYLRLHSETEESNMIVAF